MNFTMKALNTRNSAYVYPVVRVIDILSENALCTSVLGHFSATIDDVEEGVDYGCL